jgi:hypothetical protein
VKKLITLLIGVFFVTKAFALSPPQYMLQRELQHSFGASRCVEVSDVHVEGGENVIYVTGCNRFVAEGLAFVLQPQYNFGGIQARIEVLYSDGSSVDLLDDYPLNPTVRTAWYFFNALRGNPYFMRIYKGSGFFSLWVEIQADIIQFWNDDISDPHGYSHFVSKEVFSKLIKETYFDNEISVGFFTSIRDASSVSNEREQIEE